MKCLYINGDGTSYVEDYTDATCLGYIVLEPGESVTGVPALSIADAQQLGLAFAGIWALAFVFKKLFKMIEQS